MSPESYELEPKESIDTCLNCPLPSVVCRGKGNCIKGKKTSKRRPGELEYEITALYNEGLRLSTIARKLGIAECTARSTIKRLKNKGIIQ